MGRTIAFRNVRERSLVECERTIAFGECGENDRLWNVGGTIAFGMRDDGFWVENDRLWNVRERSLLNVGRTIVFLGCGRDDRFWNVGRTIAVLGMWRCDSASADLSVRYLGDIGSAIAVWGVEVR